MTIDNTTISQELREMFSSANSCSNNLENYQVYKHIGSINLFKNTLEFRISLAIISDTKCILLETRSLWDNEWKTDRFISFLPDQVPPLLSLVLDAQAREAELSLTPESERPSFPLVVGDSQGVDGSTVRVLVDLYKGRLEIKMSKMHPNSRLSGQWSKFSTLNIREIGLLILTAFDEIAAGNVTGNEPVQGDGIPF